MSRLIQPIARQPLQLRRHSLQTRWLCRKTCQRGRTTTFLRKIVAQDEFMTELRRQRQQSSTSEQTRPSSPLRLWAKDSSTTPSRGFKGPRIGFHQSGEAVARLASSADSGGSTPPGSKSRPSVRRALETPPCHCVTHPGKTRQTRQGSWAGEVSSGMIEVSDNGTVQYGTVKSRMRSRRPTDRPPRALTNRPLRALTDR